MLLRGRTVCLEIDREKSGGGDELGGGGTIRRYIVVKSPPRSVGTFRPCPVDGVAYILERTKLSCGFKRNDNGVPKKLQVGGGGHGRRRRRSVGNGSWKCSERANDGKYHPI